MFTDTLRSDANIFLQELGDVEAWSGSIERDFVQISDTLENIQHSKKEPAASQLDETASWRERSWLLLEMPSVFWVFICLGASPFYLTLSCRHLRAIKTFVTAMTESLFCFHWLHFLRYFCSLKLFLKSIRDMRYKLAKIETHCKLVEIRPMMFSKWVIPTGTVCKP